MIQSGLVRLHCVSEAPAKTQQKLHVTQSQIASLLLPPTKLFSHNTQAVRVKPPLWESRVSRVEMLELKALLGVGEQPEPEPVALPAAVAAVESQREL